MLQPSGKAFLIIGSVLFLLLHNIYITQQFTLFQIFSLFPKISVY